MSDVTQALHTQSAVRVLLGGGIVDALSYRFTLWWLMTRITDIHDDQSISIFSGNVA